MKVYELIEALKGYPQDVEVVAEWDAMWSQIEDHALQTDKNGNEVVSLDVSQYNSYNE